MGLGLRPPPWETGQPPPGLCVAVSLERLPAARAGTALVAANPEADGSQAAAGSGGGVDAASGAVRSVAATLHLYRDNQPGAGSEEQFALVQ